MQQSANESTVAIVGAGIVGTTIAYLLTQRGYDVTIFEKGPDYPYPHAEQFQATINLDRTRQDIPFDSQLREVPTEGDLPFGADSERYMHVGGMASHWEGITLRLPPSDFKTQTLFGRGVDWPITYDDMEPYYVRAENFLGVSGTDDDNPFAPPRSAPYPLPPFELAYEDVQLAQQLAAAGITIHTTPQARTREAYDGRPGCANFGICTFCPIGARYSPGFHLQQALDTGLCTLVTDTSVRRVVLDAEGRARALVVRGNDDSDDREHAAQVIILAPGAIEAPRLLLLSADERHPDGLGNAGGHVGRHLGFHQLRTGSLVLPEPVYPGRVGFWTGQSHQFVEHDDRATYGGIKIEFSAQWARWIPTIPRTLDAVDNIESAAQDFLRTRYIGFHAESDTNDQKYVTLSPDRADKFGDAFPQVHYTSSAFDAETYAFAQRIYGQFSDALNAQGGGLQPFEQWVSGHHHMGTCRMGTSAADSVVDRYGKVHDVENLYVVGGSSFASTGVVNPTLTVVALAIQTADYLLEQALM